MVSAVQRMHEQVNAISATERGIWRCYTDRGDSRSEVFISQRGRGSYHRALPGVEVIRAYKSFRQRLIPEGWLKCNQRHVRQRQIVGHYPEKEKKKKKERSHLHISTKMILWHSNNKKCGGILDITSFSIPTALQTVIEMAESSAERNINLPPNQCHVN